MVKLLWLDLKIDRIFVIKKMGILMNLKKMKLIFNNYLKIIKIEDRVFILFCFKIKLLEHKIMKIMFTNFQLMDKLI